MHKRARQHGFTLMELLVTIAMVSILIAMVAPTMRGSIERNSVLSKAREFRNTLADARATAVGRNLPVVVCRSSDGASCTGNWSQGWLTFLDEDGNGSPSADEIIKAYDGFQDDTAIAVSTNAIVFRGDGTLDAATAVDARLCPEPSRDVRYARGVIVQLSGVVRHSRDSNDDDVHENSAGVAYTCP